MLPYHRHPPPGVRRHRFWSSPHSTGGRTGDQKQQPLVRAAKRESRQSAALLNPPQAAPTAAEMTHCTFWTLNETPRSSYKAHTGCKWPRSHRQRTTTPMVPRGGRLLGDAAPPPLPPLLAGRTTLPAGLRAPWRSAWRSGFAARWARSALRCTPSRY